jgi:hypothetical protein
VAITSQHHATVEARVPSWVRLSADGGNAGVTCVLGRRQEREHLRFADLVTVVDQTPGVTA